MRIRKKILLGYILIIIVMIVVDIFAIRNSRQMLNKVNDLEISKRVEQNQSNKIAHLVQQVNINIKELFLEIEDADEPNEITRSRNEINDNLHKIFIEFSTLKRATVIGAQNIGVGEIGIEESEEIALIDSLSLMTSQFELSIQKTLGLLDEKNFNLAETMFEDNAEKISGHIQDLLLVLIRDAEMEVDTSIKEMGAMVNRSVVLYVFLTILSIVLVIIIGLYISGSISSGLLKLTDCTGEICKGNLEARVNIKSNDELELLGNSFNIMAELLKEKMIRIDNLNKHLSDAIHTKDKFLSIIAHDLKSPFNSMLGFSALLNEKFDKYDTRKQKKFIELINTNLKNTYNLLENLLLWSRSQMGAVDFKPEKTNLFLISNETIELLKHSAENKAINLINRLDEDITIDVDKDMFSLIIRNLISNAIKFTPKNGEISINSDLITNENGQKFVKISVKDTGVGIPPEILPDLFDIGGRSLTSGTENEKGTGLGLILCKEFVEKHHGKIWVESVVDMGSEFIFMLPANIEQQHQVL